MLEINFLISNYIFDLNKYYLLCLSLKQNYFSHLIFAYYVQSIDNILNGNPSLL